jgi:MauM/NapG family ferredoxin protein
LPVRALAASQPLRVAWVPVRRTVQVLSFLVFAAFFFSLAYPLRLPYDPRLVFNLDPLTHLWQLFSRQGLFLWNWAIVALIWWAALGRAFCGWMCPLGVILDFSRWFSKWFARAFNLKRPPADELFAPGAPPPPDAPVYKAPASLNLWLLGVFLTLAALKMPLVWIFDPIVLAFKFFTVALYPALDAPARAAYTAFDARFTGADWWYPVSRFFGKFPAPSYTDTLLIVAFVLVLVLIEQKHRRWWCKYVCPLGALQRISYFFSPLRRRLVSGCTACTLCEKECHFAGDMSADCMFCMHCIDKCDTRKISFLPTKNLALFNGKGNNTGRSCKGTPDSKKNPLRLKVERINALKPGTDRRAFLGSVAAGVVAYPVLNLFNQKVNLPVDFIRPPGVADENEFLEKCIKCGQCLKVCLTNGLQPALFEAGLDGLWTPRMMNRMGYCDYECNLCGAACPTGAIPPLALDDKKKAVMGLAYVDVSRCIPFVSRRECIVCEEHCPTPDKAIVMQQFEAATPDGERYLSKRPVVLRELCTGCGICEYKCPLPSQAAIRVFREPPATGLGTFEPDPAEAKATYGYMEGEG